MTLIGKVSLVTAKGLICLGKNDFATVIKNYPAALLLAEALNLKQMIFLEGARPQFSLLGDPKKQLVAFLEYYFQCQKCISPLWPDWTEPLLQGSSEKLIKEYNSTFDERFYNDPYLSWALNAEVLPNPDLLITHWQPITQKIYGELYQAWSSR